MPDNAGYYHAAYVLSGVIYVVYALSIYLRRKRILEHGRNNNPG
jgi:hypothetical protein